MYHVHTSDHLIIGGARFLEAKMLASSLIGTDWVYAGKEGEEGTKEFCSIMRSVSIAFPFSHRVLA